jgi:hypothetical protein
MDSLLWSPQEQISTVHNRRPQSTDTPKGVALIATFLLLLDFHRNLGCHACRDLLIGHMLFLGRNDEQINFGSSTRGEVLYLTG